MQSVIPVNLPHHGYDIAIGSGSLDQLGAWMVGTREEGGGKREEGRERRKEGLSISLSLGKKVVVVSNPAIFEQYGQRVMDSLRGAGFEVAECLLPAGEQFKTLGTVQQIYDRAFEQRLERSSTLVALGGGVIGDMTGFAAATWLRGINVVQVPTTLLAIVDAAIGGKTGVNHPHGKNLIGAFHQPRLVLIDPQVLRTLPEREFRAAIAEVIKYGVIWDAVLFEQLEQAPRLDQIQQISEELLQEMIIRSCQAKAHVVTKDEKESDLRAILNYGHTIGHAVESLTGYSSVNHGEAVAIGMVAAAQIAVELGLWQQRESDRQRVLLQKASLPTQLPTGLDIEAILVALQSDKKVKSGRIRFVLPTQIGAATVTDQVSSAVIRHVLSQMESLN